MRSASSPNRRPIRCRVALETTNEENLASIRDSVKRRHSSRPRGDARLRAFLRRLQGKSGRSRWPAPRRLMTPARAGWCCATPMAAPCRTRSKRRRARWRSTSPAAISASTPITTPSRRWPIRLRRCAPGARQIQGTLNGLGERCGNANLVLADPDAEAEAGIRRCLRDRRVRREALRR